MTARGPRLFTSLHNVDKEIENGFTIVGGKSRLGTFGLTYFWQLGHWEYPGVPSGQFIMERFD